MIFFQFFIFNNFLTIFKEFLKNFEWFFFIQRDLDWMNVMTYDYHSSQEPAVSHHAPLSGTSDPTIFDPNESLNIVSVN